MRKLIAISLLALVACKKETKQPNQPVTPTCDCYEYHEALEPTGFPIQNQWIFKYETTPTPDLCAKDNGEWVYSNGGTHRYMVHCQ